MKYTIPIIPCLLLLLLLYGCSETRTNSNNDTENNNETQPEVNTDTTSTISDSTESDSQSEPDLQDSLSEPTITDTENTDDTEDTDLPISHSSLCVPNEYSWDSSWTPTPEELPPDGFLDDLYFDGHNDRHDRPTPILPPGDWDWNESELANWRNFRDNVATFRRLEDSEGNPFGWALVGANGENISLSSAGGYFQGSTGTDIINLGPEGDLHSTSRIRYGDGPDMVLYRKSWSLDWRTGSTETGNLRDNDLVIGGSAHSLPNGEFDIQTSTVHTGPGNDLIIINNMTRAGIDAGNGADGQTDTIDPNDGNDMIIVGGNYLDNRIFGGNGDDIIVWYADENHHTHIWTGGRIQGTGGYGDAVFGDDTDRLIMAVPDSTILENGGERSVADGVFRVWQQDPYPETEIDPVTVEDLYARYHRYLTSPEGRRMVTFEYNSASDAAPNGHMNMASIEELQLGIGPDAKVYRVDDLTGTATYDPELIPIYEEELPNRERCKALFEIF